MEIYPFLYVPYSYHSLQYKIAGGLIINRSLLPFHHGSFIYIETSDATFKHAGVITSDIIILARTSLVSAQHSYRRRAMMICYKKGKEECTEKDAD